jgi:hypothetical protein
MILSEWSLGDSDVIQTEIICQPSQGSFIENRVSITIIIIQCFVQDAFEIFEKCLFDPFDLFGFTVKIDPRNVREECR